ncbi:MAG TPA: molybdate ABC transporter substrate-binding protein [Candidatus Dormibacteraeota bacterium]|nr:molybdate ABC transporter substrate-binding protein [Candidatus Dormibacteraeota bacterium]
MGASRYALAALAAATAAVAACGSSSTSSAVASGASSSASSTADPLRDARLTVFAAASLTEAFNDGRTTLQAAHPGLSLTYSFAGSQTLVTQVRNGAPADVIATADTSTMAALVSAGLVETPRTFARNVLEIVVAPGNPKGIATLEDLARSDLKVVLEDPSVPAGKYARQILQARSVTVRPVSEPLDVKSELLAVEQGNADAGIVYVTDVSAAGTAVTGVPIPAGENAVATYPIAVVKATHSPAAARALVEDAAGGVLQQALAARGFESP